MSSTSSSRSNFRPPAHEAGRRPTHSPDGHGRSSSASMLSPWTQHIYTLSDTRDLPWATLKVRSRALSPAHLPSTFEGEDITGEVALNLSREESIKAVVVSVVGQITTSAMDVCPFLTLSQELWSAGMGDPSPHPNAAFNGKLLGQYQWPFSFMIPHTVETSDARGEKETYPVPPSFSERLTRVHIQYQLVARIRRGKFRVDGQLSTVFAFTPFTHPGPFSDARQAAYRHNHSIPGPTEDSEGWSSLPDVHIRGTVFSSRTVDAIYKLSLAKPLAYTRGTVIPCSMTIDCSDTQALDLLSMPKAVDVRLLRHIAKSPADVSAVTTGTSNYGVDFEEISQEIETATWWRSSGGPHRRILSGEIHLPKDLKPNFRIGRFDLSYTVNLYLPEAVAFSPQETTASFLLVQPIEIVTAYSSGPRPRTYSPRSPGYDDASSSTRPSSEHSFRV